MPCHQPLLIKRGLVKVCTLTPFSWLITHVTTAFMCYGIILPCLLLSFGSIFILPGQLVGDGFFRSSFLALPKMSEPNDLILPPQVCLVKRFQKKRVLDTAETVPFIPAAPKFVCLQAPSSCRWDGMTVSNSWRPRFPTPTPRPHNVNAAPPPMKKSGTFSLPCTASGQVYSRPRLGVHSAALTSLYALAPAPKQPCRPSWPTLPGLAGDGSTSSPLTNDKPFQVNNQQGGNHAVSAFPIESTAHGGLAIFAGECRTAEHLV